MSVLEDLRQLEQRIVKRAAELRGAVDEYAELQQAASKLGIDLESAPARGAAASAGSSQRRATKPRASAKPKSAATKSAATRTSAAAKRTPGGSRQRGSRRDDVLRLVKQQPGITVADLGKKLNVNATGLYRVVRDLEQRGDLKKDGKALTPTAS